MNREELAIKLREAYLTTPATRGGSLPKWLAVADVALTLLAPKEEQ